MNIFSEDYIFKEEVKRGIHHQMTKKNKKRVHDILYKFFILNIFPIFEDISKYWLNKSLQYGETLNKIIFT